MYREPYFDNKSLSNYSRGTKNSKSTNKSDSQKVKLLNHLDLKHFKTQLCTNSNHHNQKHCFYFHNSKDKRRPGEFYSTDMCTEMSKKSSCSKGDKCLKSHNRVEQLFRTEKYKTKFCSNYPGKLKKCEFGPYCCFSHSETDLAVELIHNYVYDDDFYMFHYKTVWCPFNLNYHDKSLCVYAHNWQDFRRKPKEYDYNPVNCGHWKITEYITNYEKGCPDGYDCKGCHGWKELEYHPLMYKTKPCPPGENCQKRRDCSNYHNQSERREISPLLQLKITKLVPRNRIVEGTFKDSDIFTDNLRRPSLSESFFSFATRMYVPKNTFSTASIEHGMQDLSSMRSIHFGAEVSRDSLFDRRNSAGVQKNPMTPQNFVRRNVKRKTTIKEDAEFLLEHVDSDSDSKSRSSVDLNEDEEFKQEVENLL